MAYRKKNVKKKTYRKKKNNNRGIVAKVNKMQYKESIASNFKPGTYFDNCMNARRFKQPYFQGFRTVLRAEWQAYEGAIGTPAIASNRFFIKANVPFNPFDVTSISVGGAGLTSAPGTGIDESIVLTGVQPAGLLKLMNPAASGNTMWNRCHVIGSKCSVTYHPNEGSTSTEVTVIPVRSTVAIQPNRGSGLSELPYTKSKIIQLGQGSHTVSNRISCCEFLGEDPKDYTNDPNFATDLSDGNLATIGNLNQIFWCVYRHNVSGNAYVSTLPYKIQMEYDCVFSIDENVTLPEN